MSRKIPSDPADRKATPVILFGACDRHNLGDLLLPHIATALLAPRAVVVAGLAARDLTTFGGHRVRAIGEVLREWPDAPVVHAGGELLCCDAWEAAAMLLPPEEAPGVIAQFDGKPQRFDWARRFPGREDHAPYCLGKSQSPQYGEVVFNGVGGVDFDRCDAGFRAGAAPWHDDLDVYRRAAAVFRGVDAAPTSVFESLDIWDICALIASSAAFRVTWADMTKPAFGNT